MKAFYFISFVFSACLCISTDASDTIHEKILNQRRYLLFNSRSLEGKCLSICDQPTPAPTPFPTTSLTKPTPTEDGGVNPTLSPTKTPTSRPTGLSSMMPSNYPTGAPTSLTTTMEPTVNPTKSPTNKPTNIPTMEPTVNPTKSPTNKPTNIPTMEPTVNPTKSPTNEPTNLPTGEPTNNPTKSPTNEPTNIPTRGPTNNPTKSPTNKPTNIPTRGPTHNPTKSPTNKPTKKPTKLPTLNPTSKPTLQPITVPTHECVWPKENFSAIIKGNLISGAHSAYHHIAVGGKLENPSNSQMVVDDRVYGSSWKGKFNFNGGVEKIINLNDVPAIDFDHYEWLARNMKSSNVNGKKVIVKNTGSDGSRNGCYDLYDFRPGGQGYDNGNTLVVFNTTDDICLTKTHDGRQFGPSVLAPFSKVKLTHAGFIDGTVIAKEFTTVAGSYKGTELQLHGKTYKGPIECIEASSSLSINEPTTGKKEKDGECSCETSDDSDQTFRCGKNKIYVCPNVEKVCSSQVNGKTKFYSLTQNECEIMKSVRIGEACISLPEHKSTKGKKLEGKACYNGSKDNGMSNNGKKCEFCKDSITPKFQR